MAGIAIPARVSQAQPAWTAARGHGATAARRSGVGVPVPSGVRRVPGASSRRLRGREPVDFLYPGTQTDTPTVTDTPTATDTPVPTDTPVALGGTLSGTVLAFQVGGAAMPANNVAVVTCAASDTMCATPLATATSSTAGTFTIGYPFTAGTPFTGYFQMTGGPTATPITPTRTFVNISAATSTQGFVVVPSAVFTGLVGLVFPSAHFDSTHGAVTYSVNETLPDGGSSSVQGATVASNPSAGMGFYQVGGTPSPAATSTDSSGEGGFVNVTPGSYTFTATGPGDAGTLGTQTASVIGNFITAFNL